MPKGGLNPAQEKFFARHINKGLLGKLRNKKDLAFASAFRGYSDAEKATTTLLTNLPMYPDGSAELVEKNALIASYGQIQTDTLAKTGSQKTAIAACDAGRVAMAEIAARATVLINKASLDTAAPDPERILLLKQAAALHLNAARTSFDTQEGPVLNDIIEQTGVSASLPAGTVFEAGLKTLYGKIAAVKTSGQTAAAASTTLDAVKAEADALLAQQLAALAAYTNSAALAKTIEVGKMDAALRSALSLAENYAEQMTTWGMEGAEAFTKDVAAMQARGTALFAKTAFEGEAEANTAITARAALQAELEALHTTAAKVIQAKKAAFGQLYREIETRFDTVERAFRGIDDVDFVKGQKGPVEDVLNLTRTAVKDLNGYNTDALHAAKKLVDEAAVVVGAAQKAAKTNAEIKDMLKGMGGVIAAGSTKGNPLAARFVDYNLEHTKLSTEWQTMLLPDALKAVSGLQARLDVDAQLNKAIEARRKNAKADMGAAQAELAQFNAIYGKMLKANGRKAKDYAGEATADLALAEAWIDTKTTLPFYDTIDRMIIRSRKALNALVLGLKATDTKTDDEIYAEAMALQQQMDRLAQQALLDIEASGGVADADAIANTRAAVDAQITQLATRNTLLAADTENDRQKAEEAARKDIYLAEAAAFVNATKDALSAAQEGSALDHFKDEVKGHLAQIEASINSVKKDGLVRAAQSELTFLQKTIQGITARGPRSDKHKLEQIGTEWAEAVKGFEGKCTEMQAAVKKYLSDNNQSADYAAAVTALTKALNDIRTRLEPAAFIRTANRFRDPAQFKPAREEALQQVRYFNDLLLKDPVIRQCGQNPFGVRDFASPLASRLRQIELNVLRAA